MKHKAPITFISIIFAASIAMADSETTPYPINQVVDVSIDQSNHLKFVTNVVYPNGCFHPRTTTGVLDESLRSIELFHAADVYPGTCTQAIVPKYSLVEMEIPRSGIYRVLDSASSRHLGDLAVDGSSVNFFEVKTSE